MDITDKDLCEMDSDALARLALAIEAELERRWQKMDGAWVKVEADGSITPLPLETEETE